MTPLEAIKELFQRTQNDLVMTRNIITIYEDENFSQAQVKFLDYRASHLIVLTRDNTLAGVLSQKYLFKTQSPRKIISEEMTFEPGLIMDGDSFYDKETLDSYILRNIMNKNVYTASPEGSLAETVISMAKKNLGCIPIITASKRVVGMITHLEILQFISSVISS